MVKAVDLTKSSIGTNLRNKFLREIIFVNTCVSFFFMLVLLLLAFSPESVCDLWSVVVSERYSLDRYSQYPRINLCDVGRRSGGHNHLRSTSYRNRGAMVVRNRNRDPTPGFRFPV